MISRFKPGFGLVLWTMGVIIWPFCLRAEQISFHIPVDCTVGQDCFIQNFFDHDKGPGRKDYACGRLSYDGHEGTDFRLPDYPAMREGTAVLAAAPGTVLRTRDGMPDIDVNKIDPDLIEGRKAGNGVVIDHGHGWVTQYSHLRQGSIRVTPGQKVRQGDVLGLIGLSGNTEFPHVEFSVRYQGESIDPFTGTGGFQDCGNTAGSLWTDTALQEMTYQATGLLNAGFAGRVPEAEHARQGLYPNPTPDDNALVFWVDVFGVEKNDDQRFVLYGPDGKTLVDNTQTLETSNVIWFAYAGVRRPETGWKHGRYKGVYVLKRQGDTQVTITRILTME
jgi:hypothetical protein